MKSIILELSYGISSDNDNISYDITELVAIRLDENLHTTGTFRYVNNNDSIKARPKTVFTDENKIIVSDMSSGWIEFRNWLQEDELIAVWNPEIVKVVKYADCITKSRMKIKHSHKIINLTDLYKKMTDYNTWYKASNKNELPLGNAMEEMELVYDVSEKDEPLYNAQSMVRLFRKLYKSGYEVMGARFVHGLIDEDYFYISLNKFFPKLDEKRVVMRNRQASKLLNAKGINNTISGDIVKLHTKYADWAFNLIKDTGTLKYYTHDFYQGLRETKAPIKNDMTLTEKINIVCEKINEIEIRMQYGVGNEEITQFLKVICH
jgi:hypothetical protein